MAVAYVLVSSDSRIAGYYTLSCTNVRVNELKTDLASKLKLPRHPAFGATLIGRLARDLSCKGQGIGELLLADALKVSLTMSRKIASSVVVVDATDDHARQFYTAFGFVGLSEKKNRLVLRMDAIKKLFPEPAI